MPDWESDPHAITFPGGETIAELHHRVGQAVRDAVAEHLGRTIVVCCHGGVVNAVLRMALRAPATGDFELFTTNASLTELLLVRPGPVAARALQRRRPPRRALTATRSPCAGSSSAGARPDASSPGGSPRPGTTSRSIEAGAERPPVRPSFFDTMAAPGALFTGSVRPRPRASADRAPSTGWWRRRVTWTQYAVVGLDGLPPTRWRGCGCPIEPATVLGPVDEALLAAAAGRRRRRR